jgi:glyoxylase-like metal-dependent hydrolase (beta-lactamase superfamily II)
MKTRVASVLGIAALGMLALVAQPSAQRGQQGQAQGQGPGQGQGRGQPPGENVPDIKVLPIRNNVYMLVGAGGNVTVQVPPPNATLPAPDSGLLVVDTGLAQMSDKLVAAIRPLAGNRPLRFIFNTHVHPDHVGGNEALVKALGPVGGRGRQGTTAIAAHENVLTRMSIPQRAEQAAPSGAWPTDTFLDQKDLYFNGEGIQVYHVPNAHTDGDSIVFFRRSDVISAGDIFVTNGYPIVDLARGGNIQGVIDGLNLILDLAIPGTYQEGGTMIVPGHGRLCDEADVVEYRNTVVIIRDRIQDLIEKGMNLEQVKAAKPTLDYDRRYGATSGVWTTDMFIEAVYKNLGGK